MPSPYTPEEISFLHNVNYVAAVLSFFGSLWMAYFCLKNPAPRPVSLHILLAIAISDLVYSICNIMSEYEGPTTDTYCKVEGMVRHFSFVSTVYWTSCTAILCYKTSTYANSFNQMGFFRKAIYLNIFIMILIAIIPQFTDKVSFNKGTLFCWMNYTSEAKTVGQKLFVRFFIEHLIVGSALVVTIVGYYKAIKNLNQLPQYLIDHIDVKVYKLMWYPTALFLTFIPSMLDNVWAILSETPASVPVLAFHVGVTHIIGFTNAFVYGTQRKSYRASSVDTAPDEENFEEVDSDTSGLSDLKKDLIKAEAEF